MEFFLVGQGKKDGGPNSPAGGVGDRRVNRVIFSFPPRRQTNLTVLHGPWDGMSQMVFRSVCVLMEMEERTWLMSFFTCEYGDYQTLPHDCHRHGLCFGGLLGRSPRCTPQTPYSASSFHIDIKEIEIGQLCICHLHVRF